MTERAIFRRLFGRREGEEEEAGSSVPVARVNALVRRRSSSSRFLRGRLAYWTLEV